MWSPEYLVHLVPPAADSGIAARGKDLDPIWLLQHAPTVNRDNTLNFQNLVLQIEPVAWRATLAGCSVIEHQHLHGTISLMHGPQHLGH